MNAQFKKGVLDAIVLLVIEKEDKYGYELVNEVSRVEIGRASCRERV